MRRPLANNTPVAGVESMVTSLEDETAAFDMLGPKTRRALNEAPIKMCAMVLIEQAFMRGHDPSLPEVDEAMAFSVDHFCKETFGQTLDQLVLVGRRARRESAILRRILHKS